MWESQVLLTDGQVVFLRALRFSPTFDERSARYVKYSWKGRKTQIKKKKKKKKKKCLKQGDPCSPILFMLFINDIMQSINTNFDQIFTVDEIRLFLLLYADDAVVFAKSPEVLQCILHDIESYCTRWGLKINTSKTKAMIFEKGRHSHFDFYLNNSKLELVDSFKYLGIHFFKNGNWHRTQKRLVQHASFALHDLFWLFRQLDLPMSEKCNSLMSWSDIY